MDDITIQSTLQNGNSAEGQDSTMGNAVVDNDTTQRTAREQPADLSSSTSEATKEGFMLKDVFYENVRCLSDSTGEAQVYLVSRDGTEYVLKVYYPNFNVNKELLQLIRSFHFEMIVKVFDYGKTYVDGKHRYYELMEYLRGGTLQDYSLGKDVNAFRRIAFQAAAALAYCHNNRILHKDIKPSNFFFRDEAHEEVVLGDFGISSLMKDDVKVIRTTQARTPVYAAPEMYTDVIDGEVELTPAADFYSLGITLFSAWLGESALSSDERLMMRQKSEGRLPHINELPEHVKVLIQGLTTVNPQSRWGYDEVEKWFLGEDVKVDLTSPYLHYKTFIVDPDRNLVADNVHELIPLLLDNERLAANYLYNGRIATWLENSGNVKLSSVVKDIITNRYPADQHAGLMASVYAMEPTYPYMDVKGAACDDVHSVALSLLTYQDQYAILLQNANDSLFLWLESHIQCDINRLRSYFTQTPDFDAHVAVTRLVYEIDKEIPFLGRHPSSTVKEIVRAFGNGDVTDDDWHSLLDGRLLSWMYSHEDVMASESLRILTKGQPFSYSLAYKVLYNMDREAGYDLQDANTPELVGEYLAERLKQYEHMPAEDLELEMQDFVDPEGRFYYYAQLHGWHSQISEATRCFDMKSEENRERLSAYDLRTALYRYCRILGVVPTYLLADGTELRDGRNIDPSYMQMVRNEMRTGAFCQWLSVFYHEDPTRDFAEEYSYEHELEAWIMALGSFDTSQKYYKRFVSAREETSQRIAEVRSLWNTVKIKRRLWRYVFYAITAAWVLLVLLIGISSRWWLLYHWFIGISLTLGGMTGIIVAVRSYFKGYGSTMSILFGVLGFASSLIPVYILKYVDGNMPSLFNIVIVLLTAVYALICHLTDFSRDTQTDGKMIKEVLNSDDVKSSLIEPLYYTFKTKSYRYKSSKFGLLNQVTDQVRSISGESVVHYVLWTILMGLLVLEFCMFSPKILNMPNPVVGEETSIEQTGPVDETFQESNE